MPLAAVTASRSFSAEAATSLTATSSQPGPMSASKARPPQRTPVSLFDDDRVKPREYWKSLAHPDWMRFSSAVRLSV
ncbi:hypothetical protein D3C73_1292120 [compost metagenome]